MTQEDKQLLLKDLCARLPYGVKINIKSDYTREMEDIKLTPYHLDGLGYNAEYRNLRPYLRPMSSMTEEEKKEFQACHCVYELHPDFQPMMCNIANELNMFDWLSANHFDYRNLIGKGLALEAQEDMYKTD